MEMTGFLFVFLRFDIFNFGDIFGNLDNVKRVY